jgi:hypothetical protein
MQLGLRCWHPRGTRRNECGASIGRIGPPEEIADAVAWLFSDKSSYYTGQSLTLDGGLTSQRPYVTQPASDKLLQNARDKKWRVGLENLEISENQN